MKRNILLILLIGLSTPAAAEIYKVAVPDKRCGSICFYWWPVLPEVNGWHQDMPNSYHYSANAQAPNGQSFSNAESVIYAKALYKERMPETKSLSQFIEDDKSQFLKHSNLAITQLDSLNTADSKEMKSFQFFPKGNGNFERVSYGEEGDYYLVFTLSSRNKEEYQSAMPDYIKFIVQYREQP